VLGHMDSNLQSSPSESGGAKAAFRKPLNDAGNRKYRRRSPVSGSNSSGGSPNREHSSSPSPSREERVEISDDRRRKDDGRDLDRDLARSKYGRSSDSYRQSDRLSNRRHDYSRRDKFADEDDRKYPKLSSRSERESRGGTRSDYRRQESEYNRGRDPFRDVDKYSRDRFDGSGHRNRDKDRETSSLEYKKYKDKDSSYERAGSGTRQTSGAGRERDMQKGCGDSRDGKRDYWDRKNDSLPSYEESRGHRNDSASRRETSGHRLKESSRSNPKEFDDQKYSKEEKYKFDDRDIDRHKERHNREPGEQLDNRINSSSENRESAAKKPKLFSLDKSMDHGNDVPMFAAIANEKQSSTSKQPQEFAGKATSEQDYVKDSDIDAAKVAALKAAELVHKNLVGTTFMSTDQKKKLLWGNKNTAEESTPRWDTSLFSDRERQEKFNKLMGVKGDIKVEHKPENQDGGGLLQAEKQKELQLDLEKQYTAGLRRRDGRTVGLGL
ncbi:hypothetical protein RJ639_018667, partial [Escallonia herrerae]